MQMSHTISRVTGPKFTKFVSVVNFFIGGVNATIRVAIRPPVVEKEGRHLKKVTLVKHNPAGGIAMPGALINVFVRIFPRPSTFRSNLSAILTMQRYPPSISAKPGPDIRQTAKVLAASRQDARHKASTSATATLTHLCPNFQNGDSDQGIRCCRLANRPFLVFDFRALWRSTLSARVPESRKLKMVG